MRCQFQCMGQSGALCIIGLLVVAHMHFGADERCGQAVLDFLSSTDVGRLVPPRKKEDAAASEVSEWELRERRERQEEWEGEAEAPGDGDEMSEGEELPLFLPTTPFMAAAGEE